MNLTCAYPGCTHHPRDGYTIIRVSAKGENRPFVGMCEEHVNADLKDPVVLKIAEALR